MSARQRVLLPRIVRSTLTHAGSAAITAGGAPRSAAAPLTAVGLRPPSVSGGQPPLDQRAVGRLRKHYAINYALGAYLARNYGGATLFRDIVANGQSGVAAIEMGLRAQGHTDSFGDVLANWAVANLLSDNPRAPAGYRYNSGGTWSISRSGVETYRLGSIDLYNYRYYYDSGSGDLDGPRLYRFQQFSDGIRRYPHSNAYTTLGRMTGTVRLRVRSDSGVRITVVVKE